VGSGAVKVAWMLANGRLQGSRENSSIEPVPLQVPVAIPSRPRQEIIPRGGGDRSTVIVIDQSTDEPDGPTPGVVIIDLC
jgi:hypothetical protein